MATDPAKDALASVTAVLRLAETIRHQADEALRGHGISFARYELLALIDKAPSHAIAMKTAAAELNLPPATVTHSVTQLEKQGYVQRKRDPHDGRGILVGTTAAGQQLLKKAAPALSEQLGRLEVPELPTSVASSRTSR